MKFKSFLAITAISAMNELYFGVEALYHVKTLVLYLFFGKVQNTK